MRLILLIVSLMLALHFPSINANESNYSWAQWKQIEDTNTIVWREMEEVSRYKIAIPVMVSAYTCGPESTGKYPGHPHFCLTASGLRLKEGDEYKYVAADTDYYPIGSKLILDGVGLVTVVDTGSDIIGPNRLDLFVSVSDTKEAYKWGIKKLNIRRY